MRVRESTNQAWPARGTAALCPLSNACSPAASVSFAGPLAHPAPLQPQPLFPRSQGCCGGAARLRPPRRPQAGGPPGSARRAAGQAHRRSSLPTLSVLGMQAIPASVAACVHQQSEPACPLVLQARLKYLINEWGMDKFRSVVEQYLGKKMEVRAGPLLGLLPLLFAFSWVEGRPVVPFVCLQLTWARGWRCACTPVLSHNVAAQQWSSTLTRMPLPPAAIPAALPPPARLGVQGLPGLDGAGRRQAGLRHLCPGAMFFQGFCKGMYMDVFLRHLRPGAKWEPGGVEPGAELGRTLLAACTLPPCGVTRSAASSRACRTAASRARPRRRCAT